MRQLKLPTLTLFALTTVCAGLAAQADEGMWPFHNPPTALVKQRYGVALTPQWLEHLRLSTVRLSNCTASFVSPNGLILTNFHCSWTCLEDHSTKDKSLLDEGFLAPSREKELRCEQQVADVLMAYEDVTAKVAAATQGLDDKAANDARKKTLTQLEQACEKASAQDKKTGPLKCESVNLYEGGQYWLYKYKRYSDVRLVFAPENGIAQFGGDPDNFQFPRWCLDMSVLRAYDAQGKPAVTPNFLKIDFDGPKENEPVFVSGHPGSTDRLLTVAQLKTLRNRDLPQTLLLRSELRGRYIQFGKTDEQARRIVDVPLNGLENSLKVQRKQLDALLSDELMARKTQEEKELQMQLAKRPELARTAGDPWSEIAKAEERENAIDLPYSFLENAVGFNSRLFRYARVLVRGAAERPKPSDDRLREYRDTALPRLEQQLNANVPVYPELEQLTLSYSLERMREWLGPDDPTVRQLLGKESPDELAKRLVGGSKLADPKVRMALWKGGAQAVNASDDPMIALAKSVDERARSVRKTYEDEIEAVVRTASENIAKARFAVLGTSVYPDATFTLRLSYGSVQGWIENGTRIEPFTKLARLYERATGAEPFAVPASWLKAKDRLDLNTKFNLSTNNDIVGGNSGSPLVNAKGEIVGLVFDGNIHSISGSYWFDERLNRAVAVHTAIIREALTKVYDARELFAELSNGRT
ncbi:MAG TPA: S46 family peptidase [Steroidobacteraceae bacterium]|nr:S46 family peptidase [Steroidobacteraceae bacterium]